jgi:guanosine-3',5'-bis(diphosphate) 3'-pyrophosphohydrolase
MKSVSEILEKVELFADKAHSGQQRKYNIDPYIVHPIRVMEICKKYTDDVTILAAALLHDVLEDTPVTKDEMFQFLQSIMTKEEAERTLKLVVELTDVYIKKDYPHWNRRKRKSKEVERMEKISSEAQTIKYADIIDNSVEICSHDPGFGPKYLYESRTLLRKINKGNPELYKKALETIDMELSKKR